MLRHVDKHDVVLTARKRERETEEREGQRERERERERFKKHGISLWHIVVLTSLETLQAWSLNFIEKKAMGEAARVCEGVCV